MNHFPDCVGDVVGLLPKEVAQCTGQLLLSIVPVKWGNYNFNHKTLLVSSGTMYMYMHMHMHMHMHMYISPVQSQGGMYSTYTQGDFLLI